MQRSSFIPLGTLTTVTITFLHFSFFPIHPLENTEYLEGSLWKTILLLWKGDNLGYWVLDNFLLHVLTYKETNKLQQVIRRIRTGLETVKSTFCFDATNNCIESFEAKRFLKFLLRVLNLEKYPQFFSSEQYFKLSSVKQILASNNHKLSSALLSTTKEGSHKFGDNLDILQCENLFLTSADYTLDMKLFSLFDMKWIDLLESRYEGDPVYK